MSDTIPPPDEVTREGSSAKAPVDRPGFERRMLLKVIGIGAALSVGSGVAAASGNASTHTARSDCGDETIHPNFGYSSPDEDLPAYLEPDHVVELHHHFPEGLVPENENENDPDTSDEENGNDAPTDEDETAQPDFAHPPFFHFEPSGLHVQEGDLIQFTFDSPDHTVTAYHPEFGFQQRVPDGVPAFSSPIIPVGGSWLYRFDEPGLYDLYCGPHHILGMVMRLVVGDLAEEDLPAYTDNYEPELPEEGPPLEGPFSTEGITMFINMFREEECDWPFVTPVSVLDTSALDPMAIQDVGEVSFQEITKELGYEFEQVH